MPDATPIAAPPKRRWYQYSLRTLFIVLTLLAIPCWYVGAQYGIVAHRKDMLETFMESVGFSELSFGVPDPHSIPLIRRWFGDVPVSVIFTYEDTPLPVIQEIKHAFPEAGILRLPIIVESATHF